MPPAGPYSSGTCTTHVHEKKEAANRSPSQIPRKQVGGIPDTEDSIKKLVRRDMLPGRV
jgi:hypothetical protein